MLIRELLKDESDFIVQRRGNGRGEEGQEITCEKAIKSRDYVLKIFLAEEIRMFHHTINQD